MALTPTAAHAEAEWASAARLAAGGEVILMHPCIFLRDSPYKTNRVA